MSDCWLYLQLEESPNTNAPYWELKEKGANSDDACRNARVKRLNPYRVQEQSPHSLFHQWKGLKVVRLDR